MAEANQNKTGPEEPEKDKVENKNGASIQGTKEQKTESARAPKRDHDYRY